MDYKALLNQVEKTLEAIEDSNDAKWTISRVAETIAKNFQNELGISGGRLYECQDGYYELIHRFGTAPNGELGIHVPDNYKPIEMVLENGAVVMEPTDPGVDPVLEQKLGARRFAAIAVGDEDYILSFSVSPQSSREDILFSLNLVRYAINNKLRADHYHAVISEAQRIQQSILPQRVPPFPGFEIFGKTVAAEIVSGDFYDYIPISDSVLGLAVADGSGHGLPAALVVRDIYMGLRMGTDRDYKIIRTMEKLNHIIHRSRLTTKFVSLFYGELEKNGVFIYCNAGHNPPFVLKGSRIEFLRHGGAVLGPTPDPTYNRGYAMIDPGDVLCLYSDGIIEAHDRKDREFGTDRLARIVRRNRHKSPEVIASAVLQSVAKWGREGEDDRTIVIVKRTEEQIEIGAPASVPSASLRSQVLPPGEASNSSA